MKGWGGGRGGGVLPWGQTQFRGCCISQTHTFMVEMLLSAADRRCLCVSVGACGNTML